MTTRTVTTTLAVLALTTLAACSSSSSDKPDAAPATTTPAAAPAADNGTNALTTAVRAYSTAYFKPDPDAAYALLSARCQRQINADIYAAQLTAAVKTFGHQTIKTVHIDQASGNMARVTYTYTVPALDQNQQPWVREHGAWHYDAC